MQIPFVEPWRPVGEYSENLVKELQREITEKHCLWGRKVRPIAQRVDSDDVLFEIEERVPRYAIVHLTWSGEPEEDHRLPETTEFSSLADWIRDGMMADHQEFLERE